MNHGPSESNCLTRIYFKFRSRQLGSTSTPKLRERAVRRKLLPRVRHDGFAVDRNFICARLRLKELRIEPDYVAHNATEFQRTVFHGDLNYYGAAEPYFYLSGAWRGAKITQPSFYIAGTADGLRGSIHPWKNSCWPSRSPGSLEIDDVGHWVQHEASAEVNDQLVKLLRTANRSDLRPSHRCWADSGLAGNYCGPEVLV